MLRQLTRLCVRYAERYIPNPYLYAVILTFITRGCRARCGPSAPRAQVLEAWYKGIWEILAFAMQMALVLVTGVTLADAPAVKGLLRRLAGVPAGQTGAAITVFLSAALASWLNWGFGLVVGALVAREIAKRLKDVDFSFLVAAAYMGFMVWASGLSSSIALATATRGSALNIVEKVTGQVAGLRADGVHRLQPRAGAAAPHRDPARVALHGAARRGDEAGGREGARRPGRGGGAAAARAHLRDAARERSGP